MGTGPGAHSDSELEDNNIKPAENNSELSEILRGISSIRAELVTINSKLDKSIERVLLVKSKLVKAEEKLNKVETCLELLQANYIAVVERLDLLTAENDLRKKENHSHKSSNNNTQQRLRIQTVRVYNMKEEYKQSREACSYLYDELFKPLFTAKNGNDPGAFRVIEYAHLLPPHPDNKKKFDGFNYICRLSGRYWKETIFNNKKDVITRYNSANNVKIKISHDFKHVNRECLSRLHKDNLVKKVTFRSDKVMFKLSQEGPWKTVTNPYGMTATDMIDQD